VHQPREIAFSIRRAILQDRAEQRLLPAVGLHLGYPDQAQQTRGSRGDSGLRIFRRLVTCLRDLAEDGQRFASLASRCVDADFSGLAETRDLPNASTFCGRCEAVCPMQIPLPKLMRHWREKEFERALAPATQRYGLRLYAFLARRPRLYRLATRIASSSLGAMSGRRGRLATLPLAGGWTKHRDFPTPQGKTFHDQWKARGKA